MKSMRSRLLPRIIFTTCLLLTGRAYSAMLPAAEQLQKNLDALHVSMGNLLGKLTDLSGPTGLGGLQAKLRGLANPRTPTPPPAPLTPTPKAPAHLLAAINDLSKAKRVAPKSVPQKALTITDFEIISKSTREIEKNQAFQRIMALNRRTELQALSIEEITELLKEPVIGTMREELGTSKTPVITGAEIKKIFEAVIFWKRLLEKGWGQCLTAEEMEGEPLSREWDKEFTDETWDRGFIPSQWREHFKGRIPQFEAAQTFWAQLSWLDKKPTVDEAIGQAEYLIAELRAGFDHHIQLPNTQEKDRLLSQIAHEVERINKQTKIFEAGRAEAKKNALLLAQQKAEAEAKHRTAIKIEAAKNKKINLNLDNEYAYELRYLQFHIEKFSETLKKLAPVAATFSAGFFKSKTPRPELLSIASTDYDLATKCLEAARQASSDRIEELKKKNLISPTFENPLKAQLDAFTQSLELQNIEYKKIKIQREDNPTSPDQPEDDDDNDDWKD